METVPLQWGEEGSNYPNNAINGSGARYQFIGPQGLGGCAPSPGGKGIMGGGRRFFVNDKYEGEGGSKKRVCGL